MLLEREPPIKVDEGIYDDKYFAERGEELRGELEFKDVTFRYPSKKPGESSDDIFKNFNLVIPGGKKTGLVGPSGGGKTTTLGIIQRFYECEKGTILLDGKPLKDYKPSFLNRKIAVVQQESAIFDMTVGSGALPSARTELHHSMLILP